MSGIISADVTVIGSGISGLATAFRLQEVGADVLVLEKESRFGGAIRSRREKGFLIEKGPNSTLETTPLLTKLISDAGIEDEKLYADQKSDKRYILKNGSLVPLPMSPGAFFRTPLFSWKSKLGLLREPFIQRSKAGSSESVADFVIRRLGREFLDYAINPFVAGVYAGDPATLSVQAAFPKLYELEQKYGSLIKGQIRGARERRKRKETSKQSARMFSFREGMQTFTDALAENVSRKESGVEVLRIERTNSDGTGDFGYSMLVRIAGEEKTIRSRALVLAVPAAAAASLLAHIAPALGSRLSEIPYPPVAVVVTAFRRNAGMFPLDGFGFLIPQCEQRGILGTIFTSTLFTNRSPEGYDVLTSFVGGMRQPENALLDEERIADLVLKEQIELLSTPESPDFVHVTKWEHAIPQYTHGHLQKMAEVESCEKDNPGLFLRANFRDGISVGDCVKAADTTVQSVLGLLGDNHVTR